jgi:hypothetical protein
VSNQCAVTFLIVSNQTEGGAAVKLFRYPRPPFGQSIIFADLPFSKKGMHACPALGLLIVRGPEPIEGEDSEGFCELVKCDGMP